MPAPSDAAPARRRILVITADSLTARMAGPAIRAWHMAEALSAEHDVRLVTVTRCEVTSTKFMVQAVEVPELREHEQWCDVMILQGWILFNAPFLRATEKIMVVDIYDPLHLEQLEQGRDQEESIRREHVRDATAVLNEQLSRGDFFVCASEKQRDFWLGQLAALGRINPVTYDDDDRLERLLAVVPFGLPDDAPVRTRSALKGVVEGIGADDEVILWGGGIYNWFDPVTLVEAVNRLKERRPQVRLFFMGMRHPSVSRMRMAVETQERADDLGLTGAHVFFNDGWVEYDDRQNFLLDADLGVSTHLDHLETEFAFRTRILDYIWAQLPVVATRGDFFADIIERREIGVTVPANDVEALENALFRVLDDAELAERCRKNLASVRDDYAWSVVLEPLVAFCRDARRAPDLVDPEMQQLLRQSGALRRPRGLAYDLGLLKRYMTDGGVGLVAEKVASRVRRVVKR